MKTSELLDFNHTLAKEYLSRFTYPWEALPGIRDFIFALGKTLGKEYCEISSGVWIHEQAKVAASAAIAAPAIIGKNTEIRHGAFIRGSALIGEDCVIGNSVELKNVIIFNGVQVPHFNYVGDSILGYKAHMGAGAITSNVKSDRSFIVVREQEKTFPTGLKKFGAICGDYSEIGCNSVLNPGTIIGRRTMIYPLTSLRGVIPADSIVKSGAYEVVKRK